MSTQKGNKPKSKTEKSKGETHLVVRVPADLRDLRLDARIKGLSAGSGFSEAQIVRSLVMLALPQVEKDPALLVRAVTVCRESAAAA